MTDSVMSSTSDAERTNPPNPPVSLGVAVQETELLLDEKRTALSLLRTAIAVFVLPLSVLGLLVATSRFYEVGNVLPLLALLLGFCGVLTGLGLYLMTRAMKHIHRCDRKVNEIKSRCPEIAPFVD
jgi:uncharacterized membrane protein YidH (DUF202 family)